MQVREAVRPAVGLEAPAEAVVLQEEADEVAGCLLNRELECNGKTYSFRVLTLCRLIVTSISMRLLVSPGSASFSAVSAKWNSLGKDWPISIGPIL